MTRLKILTPGFTCANCAQIVSDEILRAGKVKTCNLDIISEALYIEVEDEAVEEVIERAKRSIAIHEPSSGFILPSEYSKGSEGTSGVIKEEKEMGAGIFNISPLKFEGLKIILSLALFMSSFFLNEAMGNFTLLLAYIISGYEIVITAVKNIFRGYLFDENFLMTLATVGAFTIGEYKEAVGVMVFYMIGEFFQDLAVERSRDNIKSLINLRPDFARILREDGSSLVVDPGEIKVGDLLIVRQGERIPVDGILVRGETSLDVRALTGESLPKDVVAGDKIISGSVNLTSTITIKSEKLYSESTVSRIMNLVEESSSHKAPTEKFITKFARLYTPLVVSIALIVAFIYPLVMGVDFIPWIRKSLIFLVISCPCALVLSIPLGFFGGLGLASRNGILIKGANYLEDLKNLKTVVLDKTGTITKGEFAVVSMESTIDEEEFKHIAALVEYYSPHPIAKSVVKAFEGEIDPMLIEESTEIKGKGIKTKLKDGRTFIGGKRSLLDLEDLLKEADIKEGPGNIYFAEVTEGKKSYLGHMTIEDVVKEDSKLAINKLREMSIKTIILSGDEVSNVEKIARQVGVDSFKANLLPEDKVVELGNIMNETNGLVAFTGDGLNDTPVLKRADLGISMGQMGSDAAIEASDIVIAKDSLLKIGEAIKISRMTNSVVVQNIIFSLGVKILVMLQSIFLKENIWLAIFADVGVALIAVINSAMLTKKKV